MEAMVKVAKEHPELKFEHATGYKTAENLNVYDSRFYQDTYLYDFHTRVSQGTFLSTDNKKEICRCGLEAATCTRRGTTPVWPR